MAKITDSSAINIKKNILACAIGNIFEWYDFIVYASLSPILLKVFFPENDKVVASALIFIIFIVGFIARPVGGTFFSYIADKYGRRKAFTSSILFIAIPSLCIALLPTYNMIGKTSAFLLLIFRLLQGFAVGGEYPILISYIAEISPRKYRGYLCSYTNVTTVCGALLATTIISWITNSLSQSNLLTWGWRIPFFITFFSVLLGFYLRLKMSESPLFLDLKRHFPITQSPFIQSLKIHKFEIFKIFLAVICASVAYYTFNIFMVLYFVQEIKFSYLQAIHISFFSNLILIIFIQLSGYLADKVGRKPIIISAISAFILFSYPLFGFFKNCSYHQAIIIQLIFSIFLSLYLGALPAFIAEQIETPFRCTIVSLAYNLSLAFTGGTAPLINLLLIHRLNNIAAPGIYLSIAGIISLLSVLFMREANRTSLLSVNFRIQEETYSHANFQ